jgi:hypothetical protein
MDRVINETIRTKMRMKKDITGNRGTAIKVVRPRHANGALQNARQVAEWNPQGKRRCGRPVSTWKDGITDSMQRRNLKGEECFDREIWRETIYVIGLRKTVYSHKHSYISLLLLLLLLKQ